MLRFSTCVMEKRERRKKTRSVLCDYFEKPRRRDVSAAVTDAANELRRRLTEYSQYVTVNISAACGIFDTLRTGGSVFVWAHAMREILDTSLFLSLFFSLAYMISNIS